MYTIPDADAPNNIIAPFWDDLDGRTQGTVHYCEKQINLQFSLQTGKSIMEQVHLHFRLY